MVFPHFYTLGLYLPVATLIVMNMTCIFINHKAVSSYLFHIISFSSLVHFSLGLQKAPNNIHQKVQNRFTLIWSDAGFHFLLCSSQKDQTIYQALHRYEIKLTNCLYHSLSIFTPLQTITKSRQHSICMLTIRNPSIV